MKTLMYALSALFFISLAFSCENQKKADEAAQLEIRAELMAIHDDVMPMMGELTGLAGQIKQILAKDTLLTADVRNQMETAVGAMEVAEEGMMDWMANLKQPEGLRATMKHEAIMEYLEEEKEKISAVSDQIKSGIETGKALIAAYQQ